MCYFLLKLVLDYRGAVHWFAPATSTDINKDKDAVDKVTRETLDKLRRGRTK